MLDENLEGTLILTPNRRSAVFLSQDLCNRKEKFQVQPVDYFINELYNQNIFSLIEPKTVITKLQQHAVIQKIISSSKYNTGLLRVSSTADKVLQAIGYVKNWGIPTDKLSLYHSHDTEAFFSWFNDYESFLSNRCMIDENDITRYVTNIISETEGHWFNRIVLFGFNEVIPSLANLLEEFKVISIPVEERFLSNNSTSYCVEFATPEDEWEHAVRWAKLNLEETTKSIAIVIPELASYRKDVAKIVHKYFKKQDVNISAPSSLSIYPLIKDAICTLNLTKDKVSLKDLSFWLRHCISFEGSDLDKQSKAIMEKKLRSLGQQVFSREYLKQQLKDYDEFHAHDWMKNLVSIFDVVESVEKTSVLKWSEIFKEILVRMRWAENILKTKNNVDLLVCWNKSLVEFKTLSTFVGDVDLDFALETFMQVVSNIPFLPETDNARVHVLGMLEASGIAFDKIWVTGMNEDSWPQAPDPNPFIPSIIQREYDLPRATSSREYKMAEIVTRAFSSSSKLQTVFSYPTLIKEVESSGSSLVTMMKRCEPSDISVSRKVDENIERDICFYSDIDGVPVKGELLINKGVQMIQDQALCPFKGYAKHRLNCEELPYISLGVSPLEHGQLLHNILADIWQVLKSSDTLKKYSDDSLSRLIEINVKKRIKEQNKKIDKGFLSLEKQRLQAKIYGWLEFEKKRSSFTVQSIEKKMKFSMEGISFFVRLDRIDDISNSGHTVIDYKTGTVNPYSWFTERISEPQLPIYMLLSGIKADNVVAASFKKGDYTFKGVAYDSDDLPGAKDINYYSSRISGDASVTNLKLIWKERISKIILEYKSANAIVMPLDGTTTCRACSFRLLCRKDALSAKTS